jgi:hypothetical protein
MGGGEDFLLVDQRADIIHSLECGSGVGSGVGWMQTSRDIGAGVHRTFRGPS